MVEGDGDSGRNLTPGLPYRARLYGGPLDGTEAHPIAESAEPTAHITVPTAESDVAGYRWDGTMVDANGLMSFGYVYEFNTLDLPGQ